jgi:hypothetical protein
LDEYKAAARTEFAFLVETHGFREIPAPHPSSVDKFVVVYERAQWLVRVQGLSYGVSADVSIIAPDGRDASFGYAHSGSFWSEHREGFGRGQVGDLRFWAWCLRTTGERFFQNPSAFFEEIWSRRERFRQASRVDSQRHAMTRAMEKAQAAFRAKRYSEVTALLTPFRDALTPAQMAKLEFSRARSPSIWTRFWATISRRWRGKRK